MKARIFYLFLCIGTMAMAQNFWSTTKLNQKEVIKGKAEVANTHQLYKLDLESLMAYLSAAPQAENFEVSSSLTVEFPTLKGNSETFYVAEASNFAPELQAQFPNIRAYRGVSVSNPSTKISFSVSPRGVQTMKMILGEKSVFMEPITTDRTVYAVFGKIQRGKEAFECTTEDSLTERVEDEATTRDADDQQLRTFRLAMSVTGEYTAYHGGTVAGALAAINATMARVNPVFERDFAVHMTLIDNTSDVIYTNASTDPYSNASSMSNWNSELQSTLTSVIGEANYDIGHLFGATGGGGNAGCIGCVCVNGQKGSGITSPANGIPEGDTFDIDYVAHEMGHQFGANHTFSRSEGTGVNCEPGSGSTIMGYAGITGGTTDVQEHSDDYFHYASIYQVTTNVKNKTCPTLTSTSNQPPIADAGANYVIPVGTAFKLTATGSDPDGDAITYCWEQRDSSNASSYITVDPTSTTGPNFRSYSPTTSPERYLPTFDKILAGTLTSPFEAVPSVARNMTFALTVSDNHSGVGQNKTDVMSITVNADNGAFQVSAPTLSESVPLGTPYNITWDVAGTSAAPFNSPNVRISYSTDGGANFTTIAESAPNSGSYSYTFPSGGTSQNALVMIESVENIFLAVSKSFLLGYTATTTCESYTTSGLPIDIPDGTGSNVYGSYAVATVSNVANHTGLSEVKVGVDLDHSYIGDLQIVLQSPSGVSTLLWNRECGSNDGINATFTNLGSAANCATPTTGDILPSGGFDLSQYSSTNGTWYIGVRDGYSADTGTFNSASIEFCSTEYTMATSEVGLAANSVSVYPNPSNGEFHISAGLTERGVTMNVYDVTGKLIQKISNKDTNGQFTHTLNLGAFGKGVYILNIENAGKVVSKKLLVK